MILELAILVGIIVFVHWWEYRSSIQEYVFAQPATLERHAELCGLIKEKLPSAVEVESLPWRPAIAEKASWSVQTPDGIIPASEWTTSIKPILNGGVLASEMDIQMGLADIDAARPWWWMPGIHDIRVDILNSNEVMNLSWVSAERRWIGCSFGTPVTVWLVHSRYRSFLPSPSSSNPINPWTLTVAEAPWIGRVQFVEVLVKPGWCLGIPAHWGFAGKTGVEVEVEVEADSNSSNSSNSWIWTADQHSLCSFVLSKQ